MHIVVNAARSVEFRSLLFLFFVISSELWFTSSLRSGARVSLSSLRASAVNMKQLQHHTLRLSHTALTYSPAGIFSQKREYTQGLPVISLCVCNYLPAMIRVGNLRPPVNVGNCNMTALVIRKVKGVTATRESRSCQFFSLLLRYHLEEP